MYIANDKYINPFASENDDIIGIAWVYALSCFLSCGGIRSRALDCWPTA